MSLKKVMAFLLALNFLIGHQLLAQYKGSPQMSGIGMPYFEVDFIKVFDEDSLNLNYLMILQILNDDLTFVATDSGYQAGIEVEISAVRDEQIVLNRIFQQNYFEKDFAVTNSREKIQSITARLQLESGVYKFIVIFRDKFTKQKVKRIFTKEVQKWDSDSLYISDPLYYSVIEYQNDRIKPKAYPNILKNFNDDKPNIYCNFSVFTMDTINPVRIKIQMITPENLIEREYNATIYPDKAVQNFWYTIKKESLERSNYVIKIAVSQKNKLSVLQDRITFFWSDMPVNISSLDKALNQMKYIVSGDTLRKVLKSSYQQKKAFFKSFWEQLDPDPTTRKNELMDEYFKRVNYSNTKFSAAGREGWETDRGRIFIKFGPPDEVENYPSQINTYPVQIWRYFNLRKEFVFIDRSGLGEYRLHPDYFNVEYQD